MRHVKVLLILLVVLARGAYAAPTVAREGQSGLAILYIRPRIANSLFLNADLALPEKVKNKGWYATWLMLLPRGDSRVVPFVQAGLIRWQGSAFRAVPFYAVKYQSGGFVFRQVKVKSSGNLTKQSITLARGFVTIRFGRTTSVRIPVGDVFSMADPLYFQAGDEVSAYGDEASGTLSHLDTGGDRNIAADIACYYASNGIELKRKGDRWIGYGVMTKSQHGKKGVINKRDAAWC